MKVPKPVTEAPDPACPTAGAGPLPSRNGWSYELLKDAVDKLKERWLVIDAPDADRGLKQTRCRWVHTIDYYNDEGKVGLYLAPKVIPFLSKLASEFTSYRIRNVAKMTSVYAIRI